MGRDDWRIRIELREPEHATGFLARLGLELDAEADELARALEGRHLVVSHDGNEVFVYASSGFFRVLGAGILLFDQLKSELAPLEDRGVVFGLVAAPQGSTPQYTADMLKPIEAIYASLPESGAYTTISGFPTVVDGNAVLRLKPWEERTRTAQQVAEFVRPQLMSIPGAIAFPITPPSLGQPFRSTPIEYVVMSQVPYPELQRVVEVVSDDLDHLLAAELGVHGASVVK